MASLKFVNPGCLEIKRDDDLLSEIVDIDPIARRPAGLLAEFGRRSESDSFDIYGIAGCAASRPSYVGLAKRYGMDPRGDGASDGQQWQIQIYCGKQYVGGGTTAMDGSLVMFDLAIYGFQDEQAYERFKAEMVDLMRPYGALRLNPEHRHLSQEELLKRGNHNGIDVSSKCGPGHGE